MADFKKHIKLNTAFVIALIIMILPFVIDLIRGSQSGKVIAELPPQNEADVYFDDGANLFSAEQRAEIEETMKRITSLYPVALVTTEKTGGRSTSSYARAVFGDIFENNKGILFVIDMQSRYLYLYTDDGNKKLSVSKCVTITDNVYQYARNRDYAKCALEAFGQIFNVMSGIAIPQPMKHMSNLLIAVCTALFAVFIYAGKKTGIKRPKDVYQLDSGINKEINLKNVNSVAGRSYTISHGSSGGGSGGGGGVGGGGHGGGGGGGHGGGHGF